MWGDPPRVYSALAAPCNSGPDVLTGLNFMSTADPLLVQLQSDSLSKLEADMPDDRGTLGNAKLCAPAEKLRQH